MKKINFEHLPQEIQHLLEGVESKRVLIMRSGHPLAVLATVGFKDQEDLELEECPAFWQMIQERRGETASIPLDELIRRLGSES